MSKDWYLMKSNTYFSGEEGNEFSRYAQEGFEELLQVSPEAEDVLIAKTPRRVIIQNTTPNTSATANSRFMLSHIGHSKEGAYVEFNNDIWLVLSIPDNNKMYEKSFLQRCSNKLKWIDDETGNLIEKPAITSGQTLYTTGIKDEKTIEIPNGMMGIQIPYDKDTKKLDRKKTFIFNKYKYELTFYNEIEHRGIIVLICSETEPSHLDDSINEIADRWIEIDGEKIDRLPWLDNQEPPIEPEPTEPTQGITYTITSIDAYDKTDIAEIWANDWAEFTIHKFVDGIEVSGVFTFEIDSTNLATIAVSENTATITAKDVRVGGNVKLTVTDIETDEIAIEQIIKIVGY